MIRRASLAEAIFVSAISLVLLIPASSKKAADSGWKVETEIIDGIKTVRNPETPRYGTFAFDLG